MSSIFDVQPSGGNYDEIIVPPEAQFPDDDEMEIGDRTKFALETDLELLSFRGTKHAGADNKHAVNVTIRAIDDSNNIGYGEAMDVSFWFGGDAWDSFDPDHNSNYEIKLRQARSLGDLAMALGLIEEAQLAAADDAMDQVAMIIDAATRYNRGSKYRFRGKLEFKKECKPKGVFTNLNLYFNKLPKVEAPF